MILVTRASSDNTRHVVSGVRTAGAWEEDEMSRTARTTVVSALLALVGGLIALPLANGPASASIGVDQSYRVPKSGTFTIRGHGFGHGHGMSQYGAYGAARQGRTYKQILAFYYPGTSWATRNRKVRVLITGDTTPDLRVSPARGLVVKDMGSHATYTLPSISGATRWRLNTDDGKTVVGYFDGVWHRYRPGGHATLVGDGRFHADVPLTLWMPSGSRMYRGWLRAYSPSPGSSTRQTVNIVYMDSYVKGVIPAEMPTSWSMEALKAQAVAARTYGTWSRNENLDRWYQICDTSSCQVYRGMSAEDTRGNQAVDATRGLIRTYEGAAAFTQFSSSSGGWTSAGSRPYLVAKADPYDDFSANPVHSWSVKLKASRIRAAYPSLGKLNRLHVTRRDGHGQWGGRVVTVVLDGTKRNISISGDTFRSRFGLRSSWFAA
jgi:stage II sporulation protein D